MKLCGLNFYHNSIDELCLEIIKYINNQDNCFIVTPNPEILGYALQNKELYLALSSATIRIPDGTYLRLIARLRHKPFPCRITGIDTVISLFRLNRPLRCYLLGATEATIAKTGKEIQDCYPHISITGTTNGFFPSDQADSIIKKINATSSDLLLVGLGAPKQELFVSNNLSKLHVPVKICVGGTFDVLSGNVARSPLWMQKAGIEWLFRLWKNPSRISRTIKIPYYLIKIYNKDKEYEKHQITQ